MLSVRERIMAAITSRLEQISIANGYAIDVAGCVQRFSQDGATLEQLPAITLIGRESKSQQTLGIYSCNLSIGIAIWHIHDLDDDVRVTDSVVDELLTEVQRALVAPEERLSDDDGPLGVIEISSVEYAPVVEGQPYIGGNVTAEIEYRHLATDPRVAR